MIVGVGGASNAGKSWLAKSIKENCPEKKIKILCQDDFVFPMDKQPMVKERIDWENPASIDFSKFKTAIIKNQGNFDIVIAEGLMVYYNRGISRLYDKKVFIEISKRNFLRRKSIDRRWGEEPNWYVEHIWTSYMKYGRIPRNDQSFFLTFANNIDVTEVVNYICK